MGGLSELIALSECH